MKKIQHYSAFTVRGDGPLPELNTPIKIYLAKSLASSLNITSSKQMSTNAVWDTGATQTVISSNVVKELGLNLFQKQ